MGQANRIPAADKAPEDFLPLPTPPVVKKVVHLVITRKDGSTEQLPFILRPGDVASIYGMKILEG
jgi:hypothetical protein